MFFFCVTPISESIEVEMCTIPAWMCCWNVKVNPAKHLYSTVLGFISIYSCVKLVYSEVLHAMFNVVIVLVSSNAYSVDVETEV